MSSALPCDGSARAEVDRHFAGTISPPAERELRAHLVECGGCRAYYESHLVLGQLDPAARSAETRLAIGLGLAQGERSRSRVVGIGALSLAAAAIFALWVLPAQRENAEFQARGSGAAAAAELFVYRVEADGGVETLSSARPERIRVKDELAFGYTNPNGMRFLLVFARDEHGRVYWYYPAWVNASDTPTAVPITKSTAPVRLRDAVSHDYDGKKLELFAVFTDTAWSTRDLEARLPAAGTTEFVLPDSVVTRTSLELVGP